MTETANLEDWTMRIHDRHTPWTSYERGDIMLAHVAKGGPCDALTAAVADCVQLGAQYGYSDRETICSACNGNANDAADMVADACFSSRDNDAEHLRECADAVRKHFPTGIEI